MPKSRDPKFQIYWWQIFDSHQIEIMLMLFRNHLPTFGKWQFSVSKSRNWMFKPEIMAKSCLNHGKSLENFLCIFFSNESLPNNSQIMSKSQIQCLILKSSPNPSHVIINAYCVISKSVRNHNEFQIWTHNVQISSKSCRWLFLKSLPSHSKINIFEIVSKSFRNH